MKNSIYYALIKELHYSLDMVMKLLTEDPDRNLNEYKKPNENDTQEEIRLKEHLMEELFQVGALLQILFKNETFIDDWKDGDTCYTIVKLDSNEFIPFLKDEQQNEHLNSLVRYRIQTPGGYLHYLPEIEAVGVGLDGVEKSQNTTTSLLEKLGDNDPTYVIRFDRKQQAYRFMAKIENTLLEITIPQFLRIVKRVETLRNFENKDLYQEEE